MPSAASGPLNSSSESARISTERRRPVEAGHPVEQPLGLGDGPRRSGDDPCAQLGGRRHDVVGDVRDQPDRACLVGVERLTGQHRGGDPARRDPPQDRHRDDRRRHTDAHLGQGERHRPVHDDEVARRHQTEPPARTAPSTAATVGCSASISRSRTRTIGVESGVPLERSFRSAPAQNAGPALRQHDDADARGRLDLVESLAELGHELARQRVAVVLGVERDRRDPGVDTESDDLIRTI